MPLDATLSPKSVTATATFANRIRVKFPRFDCFARRHSHQREPASPAIQS